MTMMREDTCHKHVQEREMTASQCRKEIVVIDKKALVVVVVLGKALEAVLSRGSSFACSLWIL